MAVQRDKKRVGRPIAYRGDPNAPELSELERRRIKRRIANRESARRVRHKRQEALEDMQIKVDQLRAKNVQLTKHMQEVEEQKAQLSTQMDDIGKQLKTKTEENQKMQQEIVALRQSLQLRMAALEDELDRRANEAKTNSCRTAPSSLPSCSVPTEAGSCPAGPKPSTELEGSMEYFPSLNLDDKEAMELLHVIWPDYSSQPQIPSARD